MSALAVITARGGSKRIPNIPIHTHPFCRKHCSHVHADAYPNAQAYYESTISLPLYPDLLPAEQDKVVELLNQILVEN